MNDNFVFYKSWLDIIESNYPDDNETQKELIRNIVLYGIKGEKNISTEKMFLQQAFAQIDSAKSKHDKRVEAGRNGGKKSKGGGAPFGNQNAKQKTTSKQQANDNVNVNDNVNDNVININNINDSAPNVCAPLNAAQPSAHWEIRQKENGEMRFVKIEHGGGGKI